jgi:hypothetical protein
VKHLLVLREQLSPFDVNFSQLRRKLDFTSTRQALASSPPLMFTHVIRWLVRESPASLDTIPRSFPLELSEFVIIVATHENGPQFQDYIHDYFDVLPCDYQ